MDKFLILDYGNRQANDSEFNILNLMMNAHFGYPNSSGTIRYAEPIIHPNGELISILIIPEAQQFLSQDQRNSLIEDLPEDWNQ